MIKINGILKFTTLENSTFRKSFWCTSDRFFFIGGYITLPNFFRFQTNLKSYSGKPDISFKFNPDKNITPERENLKTKESYVRQIYNRTRTKYYLKNGNI